MSRIRAFFGSMTGRIFVVLAFGLVAAGLLATAITNARSNREFREQMIERSVDRLEGYVSFLNAVPTPVRQVLMSSGIGGIRAQPATTNGTKADPEFQRAVVERGGVIAAATAYTADLAL